MALAGRGGASLSQAGRKSVDAMTVNAINEKNGLTLISTCLMLFLRFISAFTWI